MEDNYQLTELCSVISSALEQQHFSYYTRWQGKRVVLVYKWNNGHSYIAITYKLWNNKVILREINTDKGIIEITNPLRQWLKNHIPSPSIFRCALSYDDEITQRQFVVKPEDLVKKKKRKR